MTYIIEKSDLSIECLDCLNDKAKEDCFYTVDSGRFFRIVSYSSISVYKKITEFDDHNFHVFCLVVHNIILSLDSFEFSILANFFKDISTSFVVDDDSIYQPQSRLGEQMQAYDEMIKESLTDE